MSVSRTKIAAIAIAGIVLAAASSWYWYAEKQTTASAKYDALLQQAIEQFDGERYSETLETLQRIPREDVKDWRILYYMGSAQMMLKDYGQAAQTLEQALALNNRQTGVLYALGVTQFKLGNLGLAKAYFAAVLDINPTDEHAKGLMDIMANLERQQTGHAVDDDVAGEEGGAPRQH